MADISKINAVALADIAKLDAVLAANIAKVNGLVFTTAGIAAPAAAYSVRLLDSALGVPTYTGAAMRVRRDTAGGAGDDDEADIAFDSGIVSLDSAISNASVGVTATTLGQFLNVGTVNGTTYTNPDSLTVTASCFVDEWKDQSGNANHAEQATHGSQPQIHDGTVNTDLITENGKPALDFNGTSHKLDGPTFSPEIAQPLTNTTVLTPDTSAGPRRFWDNMNIGGRLNLSISSGGKYEMQNLASSQTVATTQSLLFCLYNTTASSLHVNDTQVISGDAGTNSMGSLRLAANKTGIQYFEGKYQEAVFWDGNISANRPDIEENINSEYLIYQPTAQPTSGLLYDYGSATGGTDAAAAYSVRQLSDKAVLCMRIRRDMGAGNPGDDDETNIGFDANGDLDTQAIADFCGTGTGYVTRWWDQSVNSNHAEQDGQGSQPQIYNGTAVITEGTRAALSFDKTNDQNLRLASTAYLTNTNNMGFFTVCKSNTSPYSFTVAATISNLNTFYVVLGNRTARVNYHGTENADSNNFNHNLFSLYSDNASSDVKGYVNGSQLISTTPTSQTAQQDLFIGRTGTIASTGWDGTIQEVIVWDTSTKSNHTAIEENINSEYLIYQPTDAPTSGLLADYTGAAAAYSVRQLSDKAVIAMRIRRDSDDEEINIGFDANGDLDTTAISDFCGTANGYVTRWADQSTEGNHADQATDIIQPQIYNGTAVITENGKPVLDFSDVSQLTTPFDTSSSAFDLPQTMVLATRYVSGGSFQNFNFMVSGGGSGVFGKFEMLSRPTDGTTTILRTGTGSGSVVNVSTSSFTSTDMYLHSGIWGSSNMKMSYNGGSVITGDATNSNDHANTSLALGAIQNTISGAFKTPEFIIWPTDQDSDGNLSGINTNINDYFSIY